MKADLIKASSRGQIVIPKEIREMIGLQEGTPFIVSVVSGIVILKPLNVEKEFEKLHKWGAALARDKGWNEADVNIIVHKAKNARR